MNKRAIFLNKAIDVMNGCLESSKYGLLAELVFTGQPNHNISLQQAQAGHIPAGPKIGRKK